MYWPEARVFLFGEAALFPERLEGRIVNNSEFLSFFPEGYNKYFRVRAVNDTQSKIFQINKIEFTIELIDYIRNYRFDYLTTGKKIKPERSLNHQEQLLLAVRRKYDKYGERPVIELTDIWQDQSIRDPERSPFWELIFAAHFNTGYVDVINIGYEGTYTSAHNQELPLPFAEINVRSGNLFYQAIQPPKLKKFNPEISNARVIVKEHRFVCIVLNDGKEYQIAPLQRDAAPYNFIQYLLANQSTDIDLDDVKEDVPGCRSVTNLTEMVRACGFDKSLKKAFFTKMNSSRINFNANAILNEGQLTALKNRK